jgi:hypothetical protein
MNVTYAILMEKEILAYYYSECVGCADRARCKTYSAQCADPKRMICLNRLNIVKHQHLLAELGEIAALAQPWTLPKEREGKLPCIDSDDETFNEDNERPSIPKKYDTDEDLESSAEGLPEEKGSCTDDAS